MQLRKELDPLRFKVPYELTRLRDTVNVISLKDQLVLLGF